ncbi:MAG: DNA-3-methyladenine glycosylase 2 family protein [Alphaproteobacteria bacterium]|nr:DNA-3-methyladenine glycosylase 2 family protein [Alphaproteobacteria bacterium]
MSWLRNHPSIRPSLEHLVAEDRYFKKHFSADAIEAIEHKHRPCSYEAFARTIVGQQLSTKAAATIWGRMQLLADPFEPKAVLKLKDEVLRGAGLSGQKVVYLRGLSEAVQSKAFRPEKLKTMSDEDVIEAITALKGFGRWSAEMVLMFALVRPDVFSGGDLGLREGIKRVMKLKERPTDKESVKLAERWKGHRTAASLLLWHACKS